jgi:hypothetical protein
MNRRNACVLTIFIASGLGAFEGGCLDRPVAAIEPLTKTNYSNVVAQNAVDQLDILFDIDNSASMGDKQTLLELAIPDLIHRLVNPLCLDDVTNVSKGYSAGGICPTGQTREFNPVHDMHLGIVSSSLGSRGGNLCPPGQTTNNGMPFFDGMPSIFSHTDDQGHLLGRSALSPLAGGTFPTNAETEVSSPVVGAPSTTVQAQDFIDWFPMPPSASDPIALVGVQALSPATLITDPTALETDFANLVTGVHAFGCGIESQLESWYRFLVQPDPYASIAPAGSPSPGSWVGYDQTILQQRHDFLRPNSLVAILVLSDENDSEIDTRSYGGYGANFMTSGLPLYEGGPSFQPARGTTACLTVPDSPACMSCLSTSAPMSDANCALGPYTSGVDWGNDANLRHVHMKQKYGFDHLQYPIQRYYLGLTSPTVPDRDHEYPPSTNRNPTYQGGIRFLGGTPSQLNCTNPLFAPPLADGSTSLPDGSDLSSATLCNTAHPAVLGRGRFTASAGGPQPLVFFAHIGGVPHQLLQSQVGVDCPAGKLQEDCPQKDTLAQADWVKILGAGAAAATFDSAPTVDPAAYAGIDPHMIEDYQPRTGSGLVASPPQPLGGGPDPINGREWVTDTATPSHANLPVDREYACIFPLVDATTGAATPRDCSNSADFVNQEACDCSTKGLLSASPTAIPAVCGQCPGTGSTTCSQAGTDYNLQYYAKAYPTIREIELVHLMGSQGILSSLCPIHPNYKNGDSEDPVFGYRPAVTSIINRLKTALTSTCLPARLTPAATTVENDPLGCGTGDACVQCLILATLSPTDKTSCAGYAALGLPLRSPSQEVLANYAFQQGDAGIAGTVCEVAQIPYVADDAGDSSSCKNDSRLGWCYVQGPVAGEGCAAAHTPQAIVFSQGSDGQQTSLPNGSSVSLQCLEQSAGVGDGG